MHNRGRSLPPSINPFTVTHTNPLEDTWSKIVKEVSSPCLVSIHTDNISNSAIMSNEYKRNSWASCWLPGTQAGSIGRTIYNNYCSSQQILLCHLHNSVLSYIISDLNLLWSDSSYTSLGLMHSHWILRFCCVSSRQNWFLLFFRAIPNVNYEHCIVHIKREHSGVWLKTTNPSTCTLCHMKTLYYHTQSVKRLTLKCEVNTNVHRHQITTYFKLDSNQFSHHAALQTHSQKSDTEKK